MARTIFGVPSAILRSEKAPASTLPGVVAKALTASVAVLGLATGSVGQETERQAPQPTAQQSAAKQAAAQQSAAQQSAAPAVQPSEPLVRVATWKQAQELIASYRGRVVVVDFWSNYCPPCIAELPQLGRIQRELAKDVVCLSINCNFAGDGKPEDERPAALKVLKEIKAPFVTLISADADIDLYGKLGIASIPVIQVYDRAGKLSKQFDNEKNEYGKDGFTYAQHIIPYVRQLAKAP
ncbi:MAG: TlpA family protein disulfide reductase [Planctomycetota bacterium]